jgi:hypothetical protein
MLMDMRLERLCGSVRRILATSDSAAKASSVRYLMFTTKLFTLESYCRSWALVKAASKCRSSKMTFEKFKLFRGCAGARILIH